MQKKGENRNQIQMLCLENMISKDNPIRVIDAFVNVLNLEELGFQVKGKIKNSRPAFRSSDLLKLYYYGYMNRVRSSRRLEREALTNLEAKWLICGVEPCYKTIANFRKENPKALKKAFQVLTGFLKGEQLFDENKIGIDGSKFRAQNSKKTNYNEKKVQQHLDYIEKQTDQYLKELDQINKEEETESTVEQRIEIAQKLDHLKRRKDKYSALEKEVVLARKKGETQISTTDRDARSLPKKMNIIEVSYNVLAAAELKNKMITNFEISNKSGTYALSGMALEAREVLGKKGQEKLTVLADKGFDTGSELKKCSENNIETLVAPKKRVHAKKNKSFNKDQFEYDADLDEYKCPTGERLKPNEKWYKKNTGQDRRPYKVRHFKLAFSICNACQHQMECAGEANLKKSKGRYIERSEYQEYIDENIERTKLQKELYRKRQETIEHQFGTIKRQWGYDYTLLKGIEKVRGEFAIIFTIYNMRRAISILGVEDLIKRMKEACFYLNRMIGLILNSFKRLFIIRNLGFEKYSF